MNFVAAELASLGDETSLFDTLAGMEGDVYREVAARRTFRFEHEGRAYFAKLHFGVGWREIVKNLITLRLPVLGAANEWEAIRRLEQLGVPTMTPVAFVQRGWNPATRTSLIVTRELSDTISLEDLALSAPPGPVARRRLIEGVARLCRQMHDGGVNHRDLYICHFHVVQGSISAPAPELFVIDLHRAQCRARTPRRWRVKDIGGLFFSTFDAGLKRRDYLRFIRAYRGSLRGSIGSDARFWRDVAGRAQKLYRAEFGDVPAHIRAILQ